MWWKQKKQKRGIFIIKTTTSSNRTLLLLCWGLLLSLLLLFTGFKLIRFHHLTLREEADLEEASLTSSLRSSIVRDDDNGATTTAVANQKRAMVEPTLLSSNGAKNINLASTELAAAKEPNGDKNIFPNSHSTAIPATSSSSSSSSAATATTTVAYLVSITSCPTNFGPIFDIGRVLRHSIETNSFPKHPESRYAAEFFVLVPPDLTKSDCAKQLRRAGFLVSPRALPVVPEEISSIAIHSNNGTTTTSSLLRDKIRHDGCCGHAELLKLCTFQWTNYAIAVHLDLDTLVTRPWDELFDAMYHPPWSQKGQEARRHLLQEKIVAPTYHPVVEPVLNMTIDAFFTKDYNMALSHKANWIGMQGGFLVARPNATRFQELVDIVKSGDYRPGQRKTSGWCGSGYGSHFWGSMTIQGLLAYYFDIVTKRTAMELHRCKYNQIVDNPRRTSFHPIIPRRSPANPKTANWHDTTCRDGRTNCDDVQCQTWPANDTRLVHYTYCKAPWKCDEITYTDENDLFLGGTNCRIFRKQWFDIRKQLQGNEIVSQSDGMSPHIYGGFCQNQARYVPIEGIPQIDRHLFVRRNKNQ